MLAVNYTESGLVPDTRTSEVRDRRVRRSYQGNICQSKKQVIAPIVAQNIEGWLMIYLILYFTVGTQQTKQIVNCAVNNRN